MKRLGAETSVLMILESTFEAMVPILAHFLQFLSRELEDCLLNQL